MEAGIKIGGIDKDSAENVAYIIRSVFESGFENHMEQETIRLAISTIMRSCIPSNNSFSNISIVDDSTNVKNYTDNNESLPDDDQFGAIDD